MQDDILPVAPKPRAPVGKTERNSETTNRQANGSVPVGQGQPKPILGIMLNYRAVTAGAIPPPPTPKESFQLATQNSFDHLSFVFMVLTWLIAKGENDDADLSKGPDGYWEYAWRGFVGTMEGNYLVILGLPCVFHEEQQFYAKGVGRKFQPSVYAASRVLAARNYCGRDAFNTSEILGRGSNGESRSHTTRAATGRWGILRPNTDTR